MRPLYVIHILSLFLFILVLIGGFSAIQQEAGNVMIYAAQPLNNITDRHILELEVNYRTVQHPNPEETQLITANNNVKSPIVYLTFDDGPSKRTLEILDVLYENNIPATFFVTGNNLSGEKNIYHRILEEGHAIGNHTFSHRINDIYRSAADFMEDFIRLEKLLIKETQTRQDIMRFPGGSTINKAEKIAGYDVIGEIIILLNEKGYDFFDWNIDSKDAAGGNISAKEIYDNVLKGAEELEGDLVVLLHDTPDKETTVEALPDIISYFEKNGYLFQALSNGVVQMKHR